MQNISIFLTKQEETQTDEDQSSIVVLINRTSKSHE